MESDSLLLLYGFIMKKIVNIFANLFLCIGFFGCSNGAKKNFTPSSTLSSDDTKNSPLIPDGADKPTEYPINQEWLDTVPWGNMRDFLLSGYATWQEGIHACMAQRGFIYEVYQAAPFNTFRFLNPLNESAARKWGYHTPRDPKLNEINVGKGEAFENAINKEETGCGDIAYKYAYLGVVATYEEMATKTSPSMQLMGWRESAEGLQVFKDWSSCMKESGYQFQTPSDAALKYSDLEKISEEELQVRMVDMECNKKVELTKKESADQKKKFDVWQEQNAEAIKELEKMAVVASKEIVARRDRLTREGAKALGM
jgi:hypothetical protein